MTFFYDHGPSSAKVGKIVSTLKRAYGKGVLIGNYIFFKRRELHVGDFTTLIVIGISKTKHPERNRHIQDYANKIKRSLETQNSNIGKVLVKTYRDDQEMRADLPTFLAEMVNHE